MTTVGGGGGCWSRTATQSQAGFEAAVSHRGQAAGGHGGWLEQGPGRHVNELSSAHLSCLPV